MGRPRPLKWANGERHLHPDQATNDRPLLAYVCPEWEIQLFDGNFRQSVDRATKPVGRTFARFGVTADVLTVFGMIAAAGCGVAIAMGELWLGLVLLLIAALPDLFDGPVAKATGMASVRGAIFDSVADRVTDTFILGGIAWYLLGQPSKAAAILPFALLGASQIISYMRAKAEIYGFDAKGGLMERAERIVCLAFALAFEPILVPILAVMLALTIVTAGQRFTKIWKQATQENPVLAARVAARRATRPTRGFRNNHQDENTRRRWREWAAAQRQTSHRVDSSSDSSND